MNPEKDGRSYYRVYIDKIDVGRTDIALESQKKTYTSKLSINRHLLKIEKYVLDSNNSKYVKLNNILQPKPSYTYFEIQEDRITTIIIEQNDLKNNATINVLYEED